MADLSPLRRHLIEVLAIEVSRLARNGRDWHTLIEFCVSGDDHRRRGWNLRSSASQ